jgi:hypothetical protein
MGDVLVAIASDSNGNVVGFVASDTGANGKPLANGGLFIAYEGLAGACSGISGTDITFEKVPTAPAPKHHNPHRNNNLRSKQ